MALMRITTPALAGLLLLAAVAWPQPQGERARIYSRPELPSKEALSRLNLRMAWRGYVPVDGRRDGLVRVELDRKDLFALTRSGSVQRMDAETGKVYWRSS